MKQLIKNVHVLTMDEAFTEYPNGYVLIEDEKIIAVGEMGAVPAGIATVIDGAGGILLPGMVNSHTHVGMIPFRSLADDEPDRLRRFLFPLEKQMTAPLAQASARYAAAEMLLAGVTSFCDMYYFEDQLAEAMAEMGVRCLLGETIIDMPAPDHQTPTEALAYCESFIKKWRDHPLVHPVIAPHATNTNPPEILQGISRLARDYQVPITIHVAEMTYELTELAERYQQTPFEFLEACGFGENQVIMAHGIFAEAKDFELLARNNEKWSIAHCIGANTKSAKGVAPVKEYLAHGVTVGLGTDGPSSGNTLDLFTQMRMFANFQKTYTHDRGAFPAKEIVSLATRGGAQALGLSQRVGTIEVGKRADLTLVETKSVNMFPIFDPYSALVYSANAGNVQEVWVNGVHKVHDKKLIEVDLEQLRGILASEMGPFKSEAQRLSR